MPLFSLICVQQQTKTENNVKFEALCQNVSYSTPRITLLIIYKMMKDFVIV